MDRRPGCLGGLFRLAIIAAVFDWLQAAGNIQTSEMRRTFNCGVGMIVVVDPADVATSIDILAGAGESAWQIGRIGEGFAPVQFL